LARFVQDATDSYGGHGRMVENVNYLAMRAQQAFERRIANAANNLANVSTSGFKADDVLFHEVRQPPARAREQPRAITFVRDAGTIRDFSQGPLTRTEEPFDLAIEGDGFFVVQGADGSLLYTRDGGFRLNTEGGLVTRDGKPVLNADGEPIVFDPRGRRPDISANGTIRVGAANVGAVQVAAFADNRLLEKIGDNLYSAGGQVPQPSTASVVQGALEASNVEPISELTQLILMSRAYEGAAKIINETNELRRTALQRINGQG